MKSILDGKWTVDPCDTTCACGRPVTMLRRGKLALLPRGHRCRYRERQDDVVRTIRAEETVVRVTEGEAARRLREARCD
jgi:hypothetical protein